MNYFLDLKDHAELALRILFKIGAVLGALIVYVLWHWSFHLIEKRRKRW